MTILLQSRIRCYDTPACWFRGTQASGLAAQVLNILFQVCFGPLVAPRARHCHLTDSVASTSVALIILRAVDLATRLRDFATNRHR